MPSRYKIILTAELPDADRALAAALLTRITGSTKKEVEFWINHLPHTVTRNASRIQAETLMEQFTKLGFSVQSQPAIPKCEEGGRDERTIAGAIGESLVVTSAAGISKKGLYLSIGLISVIAVVFTCSLLLIYTYFRTIFHPEAQPAEDLIRRGQYKQAQLALTRKIESGEGTAEEYLNRGISGIIRIRLTGAQRGWKKHLTSDGWESGAERLRNYYVSKEGNAALSDLEKAVEMNPDNPEAYKWLGILLRERREFIKAEKIFTQALSLDPENIELINFLASVFLDRSQYDRADSVLTQALRRAPEHPATLKNMGNLQLFYRHDTSKALRYYLKYLNQDVGIDFDRHVIRKDITRIFWNKYFGMALVRRNKGIPFRTFESNRVKLMESLKAEKSADIYWELGKLFAGRGMYPEAEIQWIQALKISPRRTDIINRLFRVQGAFGRFSEAAGTLRKAVKNGVATPEMFMALGLLDKYFTENKKAAMESFKQYLESEDARLRTNALTELEELQGQ